MIHRALFGSIERFFGILVEHYAGAFPAWLAPVQVAAIPISSDQVPYLEELAERTERAYAARTLGDLDALATDLPPLQPPATAPGWDPSAEDVPRRMRPPGPRRAAAKANLLRSVLWYGVLSLVLIVVWLASGRDYFWPVWPILGFALLLGWQAIAVWSRVSPYDDDRPRRRDDNP
jgi:hypothetical protein